MLLGIGAIVARNVSQGLERFLTYRQYRMVLRYWPSPQDYNEALQNPSFALTDGELRSGEPDIDLLGLPRPTTGGFASVYKLNCTERAWAVRCFLHFIEDQQARYQVISSHLKSCSIPYVVDFEYQTCGLNVNGGYFPLLKMEWVSGITLEQYVAKHLSSPEEIFRIAAMFMQMASSLQEAGIAHGDLQHGNILITSSGELRLVDYDCMFVDTMLWAESNELGHPNYQHPARTSKHFGMYLDNFSNWVIYGSLCAIAMAPELFHKLGGGEECLLFRQSDFAAPLHSRAFNLLENHSSSQTRQFARFLRWQLDRAPEEIPLLTKSPPEPPNLVPVQIFNSTQLAELPPENVETNEHRLLVPGFGFELEPGETISSFSTFTGSLGGSMLKLMTYCTFLLLLIPLSMGNLGGAFSFMTIGMLLAFFLGFVNGTIASRWKKNLIVTDRRLIELTRCRFYLHSIDKHDESLVIGLDEIQSIKLIESRFPLVKPRLQIQMKDGYICQTIVPYGIPSNASMTDLLGITRHGPAGERYLTKRFANARTVYARLPARLQAGIQSE